MRELAIIVIGFTGVAAFFSHPKGSPGGDSFTSTQHIVIGSVCFALVALLIILNKDRDEE
jgi:hypothetical protein